MEQATHDTRASQVEIANQYFYLKELLLLSKASYTSPTLWELRAKIRSSLSKLRTSNLHHLESSPLSPQSTTPEQSFLISQSSSSQATSSSPNHPPPKPSLLDLSLLHPKRLSFLHPPRCRLILSSYSPTPKVRPSVLVSGHKLSQALQLKVLNLKDLHAKTEPKLYPDTFLSKFWTSGWDNGLNTSVVLDSCYSLHKVSDSRYVLSGTRILDGLYSSVCAIISQNLQSYHESVLFDQSEIQTIVHWKDLANENLYSFGFQYSSPTVSVFKNTKHVADITANHSSGFSLDDARPNYSRGAVIISNYLVYVSEDHSLKAISFKSILEMREQSNGGVEILTPEIVDLGVIRAQDIRLDKDASSPKSWVLTDEGRVYSITITPDLGRAQAFQTTYVKIPKVHEALENTEFFTTLAVKDDHLLYSSHSSKARQVNIYRA